MKKRFFVLKGAVIALALCLLFAACPIEETPDNGYTNGGDTGEWIKGVDLSDLVEIPAVGVNLPLSFETDEFTGEISWYYSADGYFFMGALGNRFYTDMVYRADIFLSPKEDLTFRGTPVNGFFHDKGVVSGSPGNEAGMQISIQFPWIAGTGDQLISPDLSGAIFKPAKNVAIPTGVIGVGYTGSIVWEVDGTPVTVDANTRFEASTQYTAVVTLIPNSRFTFSGLEKDSFTHRDALNVDFDFEGSVNKHFLRAATITLLFDTTAEDGTPDFVTILNLSNVITVPQYRGTPTKTFNTGQYTGTVDWFLFPEETPVDSFFTFNRRFRAAVTLTGEGEFIFTQVQRNTFEHSGASQVTNSPGTTTNPGSITVTLYFEASPYKAPVIRFLPLNDRAIRTCCWRASNNNPEQLISRPDPNTTDSPYQWDYDWDGSGQWATPRRTSWPDVFRYPNGTQGDAAGSWEQCNNGHPAVFEAASVDSYIRRRAHVFTIDLGEVVPNIVRIGLLPRTVSCQGQRWPNDLEFFYSNNAALFNNPVFVSKLHTDPEANPNTDIIALGRFDWGARLGANRWNDRALDSIPTGPEYETKAYYGISARYIHIRVYRTQGGNMHASFSGIRLAIQED